ncbi:MAG: FAD-dependent oxidoreductase [Steroidobacteraceae bacterium]
MSSAAASSALTAYLARRGMNVALLEKGRIGAEQSSRNWGWCRQQNRDERELPMATRSLELWERFTADTGERIDPPLRPAVPATTRSNWRPGARWRDLGAVPASPRMY